MIRDIFNCVYGTQHHSLLVGHCGIYVLQMTTGIFQLLYVATIKSCFLKLWHHWINFVREFVLSFHFDTDRGNRSWNLKILRTLPFVFGGLVIENALVDISREITDAVGTCTLLEQNDFIWRKHLCNTLRAYDTVLIPYLNFADNLHISYFLPD